MVYRCPLKIEGTHSHRGRSPLDPWVAWNQLRWKMSQMWRSLVRLLRTERYMRYPYHQFPRWRKAWVANRTSLQNHVLPGNPGREVFDAWLMLDCMMMYDEYDVWRVTLWDICGDFGRRPGAEAMALALWPWLLLWAAWCLRCGIWVPMWAHWAQLLQNPKLTGMVVS